MAVHGTRNRESVSWDYAGVLQVLKNVAREHTGLPLLRCYWYEATVEGQRSDVQDTLADLPGVKVRLGRLRPGHRECVESEIRRDLTTLARNRAISDALVVSAEEDLTQVIADVQDLGIRVVLVHISAPGWTAPPALRQECDDMAEIGEALLRSSVELVVGAEPVSEEERQASYASRAPANGHGPPGVIGQPQAQPAGSHAAPPPIYTGAVIAEYQRAAQPASSQPPAAANASGPLGAGQSRPGENGVASLAPGGPGLAAAPPPAPPPPPPPAPPPVPRPAAPPPGIAAPPPPVPGAGPAWTPGSRDVGDYPTLPPQPGVAAPPGMAAQPGQVSQPGVAAPSIAGSQPGLPPGPPPQAGPSAMPGQHAAARHHVAPGQQAMPPAQQAMPPAQQAMPPAQPAMPSGQPAMPSGQLMPPPSHLPASQLPQGQTPGHDPVPLPPPPPLPQRPQAARAGGQHAGPPSPQAASAPTIPGEHAPPPRQLAHGQPVPPGQLMPPPGQAMPAYQAAPPPPAAPPPAPAVSGQPEFRGQVPDVAAARQAAATPRPPTVGAPPGPTLGAPPGAVPAAPPVQPGQPGQQPRGYPASMPGRVPSDPADQRARQLPVAPAQPGAGVTAPYVPQQGPHSGPQPAAQHAPVPQPVGVALADAVQAAHGEGFSFGQAVARDAPALWLEAVLARKPRMPSDLEARLLQDSSLPIDSLLHDEVRHALRRGFWDALERVRH